MSIIKHFCDSFDVCVTKVKEQKIHINRLFFLVPKAFNQSADSILTPFSIETQYFTPVGTKIHQKTTSATPSHCIRSDSLVHSINQISNDF